MRKNNIFVLTGFLLMFLKSNLFLVESTPFYIYTNIIGALLLTVYTFKRNRKFNVSFILYILLNIFLYQSESLQNEILPAASSLFLILDITVFSFPIVALLYFLNSLNSEARFVNQSKRLMKISLVLTLIAAFILLTGIFLSYSLSAISVIVVLVLVFEMITVFMLFIHVTRDTDTVMN